MININAEITGIKYEPFLCNKKLHTYKFNEIGAALSKEATFQLKYQNGSQIAISRWVSPKRTRSYPYARVYDSLSFAGKKVTIIPVVKDEGKEGDRDFLQWDTISLMSLLHIYVIISYYSDASKRPKCKKITNQKFDLIHIKNEIERVRSYQSDALHWNLSQVDNIGEVGQKALESYEKIARKLAVEMHSRSSAERRIKVLSKGKKSFLKLSRDFARKAQRREIVTTQPKEKLAGEKATLTIKNYLGGYYFFTCDEAKIDKKDLYLIEAKHTKTSGIPSLEDIKDGLLKMILFTNLENVKINGRKYNSISVLKLTSETGFEKALLTKSQKEVLNLLIKEAKTNKFRILIEVLC